MRILLLIMRYCILLSAFLSLPTSAHQLSTSYIHWQLNSQGLVTGEWQIRLYDLEQAIGIDANGDGILRWQELIQKTDEVTVYLTHHLELRRQQTRCDLNLNKAAENHGWKIDSHFNESYLVIAMQAQCEAYGNLQISYNAFFNENTAHKALIHLNAYQTNQTRVFSDTQRDIDWHIESVNSWDSVIEFLYQGIWHIAIGWDHILFLICLMLTAVLVRRDSYWEAEQDPKKIIMNAVKVVTAFTLAHSITLSLTALGFISLTSRWVEVSIAATLLLVALNGIFPVVLRMAWLTFAFGLLHGMGFAGALTELGLPTQNKLLALLGFNLGVEIGQLIILSLIMPLLCWLRHYAWYARYCVPFFNSVIVMLALYWLVERWMTGDLL